MIEKIFHRNGGHTLAAIDLPAVFDGLDRKIRKRAADLRDAGIKRQHLPALTEWARGAAIHLEASHE